MRWLRPSGSDRLSDVTGPSAKGKGIVINPSVFDCEPLLWTGLCEGELEHPNSQLGKLAVILPVSPLSNTENFFILNHPPILESASVLRRVSKVTLIQAREGLGTFDNELLSFRYEKGGTLFARIDLELNKPDEREDYVLPPVQFDDCSEEGYTVLSSTSLFMEETESDGGIVYRIPGKGGEPARAKHKAILDTGCPIERLHHTGQKLGEVYACPFSSKRSESFAIHKFTQNSDNLHAIRKTHIMLDTKNSFVLQFHANFDREYVKKFTEVKGSLPLSVRSLLVATEDDFDTLVRKLREINTLLKKRGKEPLIVALIGTGRVTTFLSHTRLRFTDGKPEKKRIKGDLVTVEGIPMGSKPNLVNAILKI